MGEARGERPDFLVEKRSIEFIPHELRHGKPSDLMYVWFGANMELPVVAAGAATVASGLSLGWTVVGIVIGVLVGTLFMASHSAQGPHLGLPQMIQSRAQFGYYGAAFPLIFVVVMYLGFYAAGVVLGAQALTALTGLPLSAGIIVLSVLSTLVAIFGYNLIHRFERYLSYLVAAVFLVLSVLLVSAHHGGAPMANPTSGFALGPFLLAISVPAVSQLGFAPYVADYARYLPESTSVRSVFWYTYAGVGVSGAWLMVFGAALQQQFTGGPVAAIGTVASGAGSWFTAITYLALILGVFSINALNIYGAYMSSLTFVTTFRRRFSGGLALRLAYLLPVAVLSTYLGFLYKDNLLDTFETFLVLVLALMSPWTAINLVDYYLIRKGRYDVDAIYQPNGIYGRLSAAGISAYLVGFAAQVPFMSNDVYTGPIARALHGGDVSWVIGVMVSGALYLVAMRRTTAALVSSP
ncbi:purine-cytosine permease family protein [Pseudonocardia spinosispora]|uniref:purine-cytosine permease family protein n=1 Tax=Pseudonocardia spinosispora TaxID=103441 RepID=UPI0004154313|nr:cytosine permease [Pseudonocardia spinosispora]